MKILFKIIFKIFFSTRVYGQTNLNFTSHAIIMPNHVSFMDPFLLYPYLPKDVVYVVNTAQAKKFRLFFSFIKHVTIDPLNPYSLKKVIALVKSGTSVVMFPEGRITTTGNLMKIYNGISMIAIKTKAKIFPIIIMGAEYSKFSRIKTLTKSKYFPQIQIHISPEIPAENLFTENFKKNKNQTSNKLLRIMQESKFNAFQVESKGFNLFNNLIKAKKIHGINKIVASDLSTSLTYKKALISSYVLGSKLKNILTKEDRVGVMLPNSVGHFITLFSLFFAGKSIAVINFTSGSSTILDCLEVSDVKTVLTSRVFIEKAKLDKIITALSQKYKITYLEDIKGEIGIAQKISGMFKFIFSKEAHRNTNENIVLYTSGSENRPKGVVLSHKNLLTNVNQIATVIDITHKDKMLNPLPMFHSFGLTAGTLLPIFTGMEVFLYPTPLHYKVIPEVSYGSNITMLLGTPTFLLNYAKNAHPYDFQSIRYVIAGGEKLKDDVMNLWSEKFGIRIMQGYGTTETAPVISSNVPLFFKYGTVGRFLPGIEWKLEEVEGIEKGGNLLVKGPNVMQGYLLFQKGFVKAPEWYNCGDVVNVDDDGFVSIMARLKRFAKISGEMISLDLVESIAGKCFSDIKFAAVCMGDIKKGEKIILCSTQKDVEKKVLREFIASNGYSILMMPANIVCVEQLPLLGNGKIDYIKLSATIKNGEIIK